MTCSASLRGSRPFLPAFARLPARLVCRVLFPLGVAVGASTAVAGPFGLDKGMTLQQIRQHGTVRPDTDPNWYLVDTLRNGHPAFEKYMLLVDPQLGLCKIVAVGKDLQTNVFGERVKSEFSDLTAALSSKYGTPTREFDFLRSGSIWDEPRDFMMALVKEERTLMNYWGNALPDQLQSILLRARALNTTKGYVNLAYEFRGIDQCMERAKGKANSSL